MKLNEYMGLSIHLQGKNQNYTQRMYAAIGIDANDISETDNLSPEEFNSAIIKGAELISFESDILIPSINIDNIEYPILQPKDMNVEVWMNIEETIEANNPIQMSYPGLLSILSNYNDLDKLGELDHKIAMNIISFFLNIYQSFEENIQAFISLNIVKRKLQTYWNLDQLTDLEKLIQMHCNLS